MNEIEDNATGVAGILLAVTAIGAVAHRVHPETWPWVWVVSPLWIAGGIVCVFMVFMAAMLRR